MAYIALGKFSSARDEVLYDLASWNEWADATTGEDDWGAWYWKLDTTDLPDEELALVRSLAEQVDAENADATVSEVVDAQWIIETNSQGFVSVARYDTRAELNEAWERIEEAYAEWYEDEQEREQERFEASQPLDD